MYNNQMNIDKDPPDPTIGPTPGPTIDPTPGPTPDPTTGPKYVNRGTYGCIYQPMIQCSASISPFVAEQYISKISKQNDSEERIGTLLRHIPHYQYYFAPIIMSCPINLGEIDEREIKKCEIMDDLSKESKEQNPISEYKSYKIRYVGKYHVAKYIDIIRGDSSKNIVGKCIEMHIHLLRALTKMGNAHLVHYDLKNNNIIIDDRYHTPIIIDFGISFETTSLDTFDYVTYKNIFYSDYNVYPPWCIDIILLSYIILNVPDIYQVTDPAAIPAVFDRIISDMEIKHLEDTYIKFLTDNQVYKNMTMSPKTTPAPPSATIENPTNDAEWKTAEETKMKRLLVPFLGKTWKELIAKLIVNIGSWDNYSLAIIMKEIMKSYNEPSPYIDILTHIIASDPETRPTAEKTLNEIIEWTQTQPPAQTQVQPPTQLQP